MRQLDFFLGEKSELEYLKEDFQEVRQSSEKVRRSLFARHAELSRMYLELVQRMEIIERNICKGNKCD